MNTLYWHDYETWGTDPSVDRPSQFAGVRTNEALDIIGEPLVIYCKPPEDILPQPEACLVTGISPQLAEREGLPEAAFIRRIHDEMAVPGTCSVGYNSLRFDDEVTRYTLYRNFYDPYEREWRDGNSRWDIIDMLRFCYAVRPNGIEWPVIDGKPSFRLEALTAANGIGHASAHDAYSDVEATINLAKMVKTVQPGLYDYVYQHKHKSQAAAFIDLKARKPLLHISSKFSAKNGCAALIAPIAMHPTNKNAVIVFNLQEDPRPLVELDVDEIRKRIFTADSDLPDGVKRISLKSIHLNKCPVLATPKLLDPTACQRTGIDKQICEQHWQLLKTFDIEKKIQAVFEASEFPLRSDPERQLYDGFIATADKHLSREVRQAGAAELAAHNFVFDDARLQAMLPRYKARNFPSSLSNSERADWKAFCQERIVKGDEACLSLEAFQAKIGLLRAERQSERDREILTALEEYIHMRQKTVCAPTCAPT